MASQLKLAWEISKHSQDVSHSLGEIEHIIAHATPSLTLNQSEVLRTSLAKQKARIDAITRAIAKLEEIPYS